MNNDELRKLIPPSYSEKEKDEINVLIKDFAEMYLKILEGEE